MNAQDLVPHIAATRMSALRALLLLGLYGAWLLSTWLGPSFAPAEGFDLALTIGLLVAYSALTVGTFVMLVQAAVSLVRSSGLRRSISLHVAPFWMVATSALLLGGMVRRYASTDDVVVSSCFALGVGCAVMLTAGALARLVEVSGLESDRRQLDAAGPIARLSLS